MKELEFFIKDGEEEANYKLMTKLNYDALEEEEERLIEDWCFSFADTDCFLYPDSIQIELEHLIFALKDCKDKELYDKVYAAQQALAWVLNPKIMASPLEFLLYKHDKVDK